MSSDKILQTFVTVKAALDAAKDVGHFWIFNSSDKNGERPKGNTYTNLGSKGDIVVFFPPTWIPIDLLTYGTEEDIAASRTLRENHRRGLVMMITDDSAQILLKSPNYQRELRRVQEEMGRRGGALINPLTEVTVNTGEGQAYVDPTRVELTATAPIPEYIQELLNVQKAAFGSGDDTALISNIRRTFPTLTARDFELIILNSKNTSSLLFMAATDAQQMVNENGTVNVEELPAFIEMATA